MTSTTDTLDNNITRPNQRAQAYVELAKLRLVAMVLITTSVGFYVASTGTLEWMRFIQTIIGTGLAAAGVLVLNQYIERDLDAQMARTCHRPLPDKRL